jgi:hypothetical protein
MGWRERQTDRKLKGKMKIFGTTDIEKKEIKIQR